MYCQLLGWITISIPELNYTLKEEFLNNYKLNLVYDMDFSEDNEKNKIERGIKWLRKITKNMQ